MSVQQRKQADTIRHTSDTAQHLFQFTCPVIARTGTGKHLRYLAAHQIAACLVSLALPVFQVRYCVSICWTWKENRMATWNSFPELTNALLELAHAPTEIPEQSMHVIERFVILIYDRTSTRLRRSSLQRLLL